MIIESDILMPWEVKPSPLLGGCHLSIRAFLSEPPNEVNNTISSSAFFILPTIGDRHACDFHIDSDEVLKLTIIDPGQVSRRERVLKRAPRQDEDPEAFTLSFTPFHLWQPPATALEATDSTYYTGRLEKGPKRSFSTLEDGHLPYAARREHWSYEKPRIKAKHEFGGMLINFFAQESNLAVLERNEEYLADPKAHPEDPDSLHLATFGCDPDTEYLNPLFFYGDDDFLSRKETELPLMLQAGSTIELHLDSILHERIVVSDAYESDSPTEYVVVKNELRENGIKTAGDFAWSPESAPTYIYDSPVHFRHVNPYRGELLTVHEEHRQRLQKLSQAANNFRGNNDHVVGTDVCLSRCQLSLEKFVFDEGFRFKTGLVGKEENLFSCVVTPMERAFVRFHNGLWNETKEGHISSMRAVDDVEMGGACAHDVGPLSELVLFPFKETREDYWQLNTLGFCERVNDLKLSEDEKRETCAKMEYEHIACEWTGMHCERVPFVESPKVQELLDLEMKYQINCPNMSWFCMGIGEKDDLNLTKGRRLPPNINRYLSNHTVISSFGMNIDGAAADSLPMTQSSCYDVTDFMDPTGRCKDEVWGKTLYRSNGGPSMGENFPSKYTGDRWSSLSSTFCKSWPELPRIDAKSSSASIRNLFVLLILSVFI